MKNYTKYEKARLIGTRALQISMGAPLLVKLTEEELKKLHYNTIEIAKLEFEQGLIPIEVKAPLASTLKKEIIVRAFDQTRLE